MVKESNFNTFLYCSKLSDFGGSVYSLHPSQLLIYCSLKDLNLKIFKNEVTDLNKTFIELVKKNIKKYYPNLTSLDDLQYLINWSINLYNSFYNLFPITKFTPLSVDFEPIHNINNFSIAYKTDIILFEQSTRSKIHILNFYPTVDEHLKQNDFLSSAKISFFKEVYSNLTNQISVKVHYLSTAPASFRNRSQRNYSFKHFSNGRVKKAHQQNYIDAIEYYTSYQTKTVTKPYCVDYHCQKRKECQNG
jgi:hypothetical protein